MILKQAYSILELKAVNDEKRIIEGIATTPTPDRVNDVIVTEGIEFKLPFPLLYQHNSRQPIGSVTWAKVTKDGMAIKAQVADAGIAVWLDEAWNLIKARLVRGLSVGFRSLEESWDRELGGFRFLRTELMELSAVTIPANAEATITAVKSACDAPAGVTASRRVVPVRFDFTQNLPGVTGAKTNGKNMTIREQIAALEAKRAAIVARNEELLKKSADSGSTLDEAEGQEFDGNQIQVGTIDKELVRYREHEKTLIAKATPISEKTAGTDEGASAARGGVIRVKGPDLPKGTAFTRYAIALCRAKGFTPHALEIARAQKSWREQTPEVERVLKAAVDAGTTTDAGWASELADYTYMAAEFIEFLRPQTIIGKINGLRRVPFNIKMPLQDAGSSVNWVGEGAVKPVSKLNFDTVTLRFAKAAGIVVLTDELVRFSNPSAEALVRADLAAAIAQFLDEQFVDPTVTAVTNVSPASVTNGAAHSGASGTTAAAVRTDFKTLLTALLNANIAPSGGTWIMQPVLAVSLGLMLNALAQPEFPSINADGGTFLGYQVVTSNSVPSGVIVFLKPSEIMLADDGQVVIDASREASLVMDDGASPVGTTLVSLWQRNMVALRAERFINWQRRRDEAVYYLTGANYA